MSKTKEEIKAIIEEMKKKLDKMKVKPATPPETKKFVKKTVDIVRTHKSGNKFRTSDIYDSTDPASLQTVSNVYSAQQVQSIIAQLGTTEGKKAPKATDEELMDATVPRGINGNAQREAYQDYLAQKRDLKRKNKESEKRIAELKEKIAKLKEG